LETLLEAQAEHPLDSRSNAEGKQEEQQLEDHEFKILEKCLYEAISEYLGNQQWLLQNCQSWEQSSQVQAQRLIQSTQQAQQDY
jgi:hemoglobin-like flavoprotein